MASVIASARRSTVSIFEAVGTIADNITLSLDALTCGIESLNGKAREMRDSTLKEIAINKAKSDTLDIQRYAADYLDEAEQLHRRLYPNRPFDRDSHADIALQLMSTAVDSVKP